MYKRGNIFWERFEFPDGTDKRISLKTKDEKMAKKICEKIRTDILMDKHFGTKLTRKKKTVKEVFNDWWDLENSNWRAGTFNAYSSNMKFWVKEIGDLHIESVTLEIINDKIKLMRTIGNPRSRSFRVPNSIRTIHQKVALAKKVFEGAKKLGLIDKNPFDLVETSFDASKRVRYFKGNEKQKIFAILNLKEWRWLRDFALVANQTGLRRINLCGMTWDHIDWKDEIVRFDSHEMKNKKPFSLDLNQVTLDILQDRFRDYGKKHDYVFLDRNDKPITTNITRMANVSGHWNRMMKKVGVKDFKLHDLRHDFCSTLVQNDVDIYVVSQLAGHSKVEMTERYAHLAPAQTKNAMKVFDRLSEK